METPLSFVDLSELAAPQQRMPLARGLVATARGAEFDFVQGPLWHCLLLRLGSEHHVLALAFSHLIIDGVSLVNFLRQLGQCYAGEVLAPLSRQYRHFAEESRGAEPNLDKRLEYWRRHFTPLPGRIPFPTDFAAEPPSGICYTEQDFTSPLSPTRLRELASGSRPRRSWPTSPPTPWFWPGTAASSA